MNSKHCHWYAPLHQLVVLTTLFTGPVQSQPPHHPRFEHINVAEGLPSGNVPCLIQDRTGFLWFGTFYGIARYDGYTLVPYRHRSGDSTSITNAMVEALCDDSEGNLWVGHARGLDKLNRATNTFTHYVLNSQQPLSDWSNHVLALHEDRKGVLWIGTGGGLYTFDRVTESFTWLRHDSTDPHSLGHNAVSSIYEDRSGSLWITTGGGLDRFDRETNTFVHYWHLPNNQYGVPLTSIYWVLSIYEDKSGSLWLGTGGGIVKFDRQAGEFTQYHHDSKNPASLANNTVLSICEDQSRLLWISTKAGLDVFDKKTKRFSHYVHDEQDPGSLSSNDVGKIILERSGTLWISTYGGGGVNKFDPSKPYLRRYTHEMGNLPVTDIQNLVEDKRGILWAATGEGLVRFDPNTETFERHPPYGNVDPIIEDGAGNLWISTFPAGLYKRDQRGRLTRYRGSAGREIGDYVSSMWNGRDGGIWLGTSSGNFFLLHPASGELTFIRQYPTWIEVIYEDRSGLVWIGTRETGLLCYDPSRKSFNQFTSEPRDPSSLSSNNINHLCEDNAGVLWIVAGRALNKYNRQTRTFTRLTEQDGFPADVFYVFADENGNLWMDTPKGNVKYDQHSNRFKTFGDVAGWAFKMRNGEMYFVRKDRITRVHPDSLHENTYAPQIAITSFRKFETPSPFGKEIRLAYTENFISFEFAALSYVNPKENQYAYRMEGLDKDWVYSGARRYAGYPHLEPGEYVFRVKGSNNDGVWNEEGASIAVIITPPWWKTTWFTVLLWVTVTGSVGGTVRYVEMRKLKRRIEQLEREHALERERTRISQDMHDEVGSSLSEIAILSELAKKKPGEANIHVQEISERAAEVIDSVSEIVWAMNPKNDTLDNLVAHMRRHAVKYLTLARISCKFVAPDAVPSSPLTAEVRRNLFLVVKEALHNVVKHSRATEVSITVKCEEAGVEILIADNGRGFAVDERLGAGNGLNNMNKRIADISGKLSVKSEPGCGTSISLALKLVQPNDKL